ncbi:fimbria/pilus periplasmic chaperone [Spirochaeta dissipatitropha]
MQPISQTFEPQGSGSSRSFQLHNPGNTEIAVELSMLTRELQPDGTEIREPADDLFSVFPSRLILEANERRTVRVRWTGPESITREQSYRLLAEQLPISFEEQETTQGGVINISFRYLAAIYITPRGAKPDVQISIESGPDQLGEPEIIIRLENLGTAHQLLNGLEITVQLQDGSRLVFSSNELEGLAQHNLLAGTYRRYRLELPDGSTAGAQNVEFSLSN